MAHSAAYNRRPPHPTESGDSEDHGCHISKPQPFNPRKRQRPEQRPPQESLQLLSKRHKLSHSGGSPAPAEFWDNLSKIWLTKSALKELDQRNTQRVLSVHRSCRRSHRPVTRHAVAEWKEKEENWEPTKPAVDFLTCYSAGCLKDIKLFALHGGPDLSDLQGYRKPVSPLYPTISSSQSDIRRRKRNWTTPSNTKSISNTKSTTNTKSTRNTRPHDRNFQQNLIDGGVYPHCYEYPDGRIPPMPNNWEEINRRLAMPRYSLSPSRFLGEAHNKFVRADAHASKEKQVMESVIPIIEGEIKDAKCVSGGIPFTNLDYLTDGTLVPGNPDRYYGARPEQLKQQVRTELRNHIIPSTQDDLPAVPNFFLAGKGPDGSLAVAGRQASYDGALGARGIHSLQSYGQEEPVYDNNAYTITSTYHGGQLKIYTSHPAQPNGPGSRPEYYMTQLKGWSMTGDPEAFRQGATVFRNARDWAKEQRDEAIRYANSKADDIPGTTPTGSTEVLASRFTAEVSTFVAATSVSTAAESQSQESSTTQIEAYYTNGTAYQESETSTDELAVDGSPPAKRSSGSRQPRYRKR